jgi:hypothetical protein
VRQQQGALLPFVASDYQRRARARERFGHRMANTSGGTRQQNNLALKAEVSIQPRQAHRAILNGAHR